MVISRVRVNCCTVVGITSQLLQAVRHSWYHAHWQLPSTLFLLLSSDIISLCGPYSHPSCFMKLSFLSSFPSLFSRRFCFWLAQYELQLTNQLAVINSSVIVRNTRRLKQCSLFYRLSFLSFIGCQYWMTQIEKVIICFMMWPPKSVVVTTITTWSLGNSFVPAK